MITKLEQVKTIDELITLITAFGISTKVEDVCRMQDIVGNTSIGKLVELANDTGAGTGRRGTQAEMMHLLYTIWHWEDATRFYNQYVNPVLKKEREEAERTKQKLELETIRADHNEKLYKDKAAELNTAIDAWNKETATNDDNAAKLREAENEILRLKAMLFDYMTA